MIKNIIKFSATWCGPCRSFAPIFEEVSKMDEYKDIVFSAVDIEEDENGLAEKYSIRSIPTIVILDNENNVLRKVIGSVSKRDFIALINELM